MNFKKLDYVQRFSDLIILHLSWIIAYTLRFKLNIGGIPPENYLFKEYYLFSFLHIFIAIIVFKSHKLYGKDRISKFTVEMVSLIKAYFISFFIFLAVTFFITEFRISRVHLILYSSISLVFLGINRTFFKNLFSKIPEKILAIGQSKSLTKFIESKIRHGANIFGWIDPPPEFIQYNTSEIENSDAEKEGITSIVIGYEKDSEAAYKQLEKYSESIIPLLYLPDMNFTRLGYSVFDYDGHPIFSINEPNIKMSHLFIKRVFDFLSASIGMLLISPLLIIIALAVKLTSKGPIFFGQERISTDGATFKMWKFRSMVTDASNTGGWTVKDDPRVTRVGSFLRKTSLDELPQLWNVIVGDMSLVGPRPERPVYVEQFRKKIPGYMIRHKFKAGITGWAQINGWRGDTSIEKRIDCDLWYIKNWSLLLDLNILLLTFWKGFINKNAY